MMLRVWTILPFLAVALSAGASGAAPASRPAAEVGKPKAKEVKDAKEAFDAVATAYMTSNWDGMQEAQKALQRYMGQLTPQQRGDLTYMRATAADFRPPWWKACAGTVPAKIKATLWGHGIVCNYAPADAATQSGHVNGQRIDITVSWNPSFVDSTAPLEGKLADEHHLTRGDVGEVVVWRQLGLGYITTLMPPDTLLNMYQENQLFYSHLQSFFAELTCIYHCSPRARKNAILVHGTSIREPAGNAEGYIRSCRAISAMFLSILLEDPKKWPSIQLPDTIPDEAVEKNVAVYVDSNILPSWTVEEDRAFREAIKEFFHANGDRALKQRGKLLLPNKLTFMLMEPDDRAFQDKRDAWVKEKLQKLAK
jgi:hypothetical protein